MEYILKSRARFICTMAQKLLRKSGIKSEVEPILLTNRTYGLAVAEEDIADAKKELWGRGKRMKAEAENLLSRDEGVS